MRVLGFRLIAGSALWLLSIFLSRPNAPRRCDGTKRRWERGDYYLSIADRKSTASRVAGGLSLSSSGKLQDEGFDGDPMSQRLFPSLPNQSARNDRFFPHIQHRVVKWGPFNIRILNELSLMGVQFLPSLDPSTIDLYEKACVIT
ncbi:hypothetical protein BT93_G2020 [Corymbia citriodora subsp. variegata]|nr:hypothetical protein BT93_G2020 [Corymbia citriodora subsp. variegata]